jgi:hypothetical protein
MAVQPSVGPWTLYQFLNPIHCRYNSLDGGSAHHKASTYTQEDTNTENIQTSMLRVGFEPTTPLVDWAKPVYSLDQAGTVTGPQCKFAHYKLYMTAWDRTLPGR